MRRKYQIIITRMNRQISNSHRGKMVAFKLRPVFSTIDRYPKAKLGTKKEQLRLHQVFFDHMSVPTNALAVLSANKRRPRFTVISRFENIRRHVAKSMPIKR